MRRRWLLAATCLCACLALPAAALADGDPASDLLLYQQTYLPYKAPSAAARNNLNAVVAAANKAGYPVRVAVIQSPTDLGSIPQLFGKPQTYASFLAQELAFGYKKRLLVVMPAGFGLSPGLHKATGAQAQSGTGYAPKPDPAELKLVARLPKPSGSTSDELANAAAQAVRKLALAAGHKLPAHPPVPGGGQAAATTPAAGASGSSSGSSVSAGRIAGAVAAALAIVAVGLGAVALVLRRTNRAEPPDGDPS